MTDIQNQLSLKLRREQKRQTASRFHDSLIGDQKRTHDAPNPNQAIDFTASRAIG